MPCLLRKSTSGSPLPPLNGLPLKVMVHCAAVLIGTPYGQGSRFGGPSFRTRKQESQQVTFQAPQGFWRCSAPSDTAYRHCNAVSRIDQRYTSCWYLPTIAI